LRRRLVEIPSDSDALFLVALAVQARGEPAHGGYERVLAVAAAHTGAAINAAVVLAERGQVSRAARLLRRAMAIDPALPPAHGNLGLCLLRAEDFAGAIAALRRTLGLAGIDLLTLLNLGVALERAGRKSEAQAHYRLTVVIAPDFGRAIYNEALLAQARGDMASAIGSFKRTLAIAPEDARVHSNLLFALAYRADRGNRMRAAEAIGWGRRHRPVMPPSPPVTARDPDRRLRLGYLSADLRASPVARNIEGLIGHHDRSAVEVAMYSVTPTADAVTARLRGHADLWRDLALADDGSVAETIRKDRVDILVVLGGHTGDNRPRIATFRPAPIMVSAHDLGTSGMAEIGYWLTDAVLHPPDSGEPFVERLVRLPCFYLQTPPAEAPPVEPRPADRRTIGFVSANNPAKLSPATIALWSRVLAAVPDSTLALKFADAFEDPATQRRHVSEFARHGISPERLSLVSGSRDSRDHLAAIGMADIALDPFPFNGSTTSFEALWMGLPVVTLAGSCFVGRVGASLLTAIGLPELIARDEDAYIGIARALATDSGRLAALRAGLRARVSASPLCQPAPYARSVEAALREMWRRWCAGEG